MNELEIDFNQKHKENLLEHHHHFLSTHRGTEEHLEFGKIIHSEKLAFKIAFPFSNEWVGEISDEYTIYLPQWVEMNDQVTSKYEKVGSLTYMILDKGCAKWETNSDITVNMVSSLSDMEDFSLAQGKGFCENDEEFNEWYPWMRGKNIENLDENTQNFYVAYKDDKPIGVALCIYHGSIAGIYAVTTLPEHRKKGVSTTLLQRAVDDAISNEMNTIILQTATESYAHRFYKKLGFNDEFACSILKVIR